MRFTTPILAAAAAPDAIHVDPDTGLFMDSHGRTRIFHGVNVVFKQAPWLPVTDAFDAANSVAAVDIENMRKWGFNVVRLGVMWPGVESSPGQINATYLQEVEKLTSALGDAGIYTLVDLHQDLLSRHFCGEGVPEGYVDDLLADPTSPLSKTLPFPLPAGLKPTPLDKDRYPSLQDCLKETFGAYYESERVGELFKELYTPGRPLNAGYLRYWKAVAEKFAEAPQVVGYELLNEPSGFCLNGTVESCLRIPFFSNHVEGQQLAPLYQAAAAEIRQVDKRTPIFYEPVPDPKFVPGALPFFPERVLKNETQQVFAYHVYCSPGATVDDALCKLTQALSGAEYFGFLKKNAGVGGFLTEFGAVGPAKGELDQIARLLDTADAHLQSWTYWQLKYFHDLTTQDADEPLYDGKGNLENAKVKMLSRTYAPAIAGKAIRMKFDDSSSVFSLTYLPTITSAPTEVYLSEELRYSAGYTVDVSHPQCVSQERKPNLLLLHSVAGCERQQVVVTVKPGTDIVV